MQDLPGGIKIGGGGVASTFTRPCSLPKPCKDVTEWTKTLDVSTQLAQPVHGHTKPLDDRKNAG